MNIDVFLSEICASYYQVRENVERAIASLGIKADVIFHTIYFDDAVNRNIKGSPSIWINGKDAFEGGNSPGIT